jgi:peptidoglycan-N-acetylglucosamine deacetylase
MYLIKTPWWLKALYPKFIWNINVANKVLYLTFDDGPHPTATPFVLNELKKYNAKATFFCIGKNVVEQPIIYQQILDEGHAVGNHTYNHLNGWKTNDEEYVQNIQAAAKVIDSHLFRPPYGRITRFQARLVESQFKISNLKFKIIMWDVLSGDFDTNITPQKCLANVVLHAKQGSIILFHDSTKAWDRMSYALPKVLEHFSKEGYRFERIVL